MASMVVGRIEDQGDRVLLHSTASVMSPILNGLAKISTNDFCVITNKDRAASINIGDVVEYEAYGVNFGFLKDLPTNTL